MRRLLSGPWVYVAWLVVLVGALFAADAMDPYVFGVAVFVLGAATGVISLAGVFFVLRNPAASRGARRAVSAALLIAMAAVLWALAILSNFRWA